METAVIIELIKVAISSAYTLSKLANISDEDREKLFEETLAEVKKRNPNELPEVK